ncbi:hypothetical protein K8R42_01180 [bacterium]|nr:hypothetical protein [bacterium]
MIRRSESTSCPDAWLAGGIATVMFGAFMGPLGLLIGAVVKHSIQKDHEEDLDALAEVNANKIARTWALNRLPGETTLKHSTTIGSGGLLIDLPVTRTYVFKADSE